MSFFPSPVLVRLQELKLWQGNYDGLLKNKSKGTNPSDFESIEGVSALDSTHSSPFSSPERNRTVDWDKKEISPSKPFEQLLEEKLALDKPVQVQAKPKRPFLKKGSGLARYKLNQEPPRSKTGIKVFVHRAETNRENRIKNGSSAFITSRCSKWPRISNTQKKEKPEIDLTPLTMPDFTMKTKATWHDVLEDENANGEEKTEERCDKSSDNYKSYQNSFNSHIIDKINDFNLRRLLPPSPRKATLNRNYSDSISTIPEVDSDKSGSHDEQSCHEKSTENELRIFEALEERVEHSSFSSTNSSIMRLLSSTPNKVKSKFSPGGSILNEPNVSENEIIPSGYHIQGIQNIILQKKLHEVNKRTDVLQDFLKNLRKMGNDNSKTCSVSSTESVQEKSPETSFSDEEKWSTHTDMDVSPSTSFTDTFKANTISTVDVAVNTSPEEKNGRVKSEECRNCEELRKKLEGISKRLPDIQEEKARVCDFAKELEAKRDQLFRDMEKMKHNHEKIISELGEELENEKRKFAREKMVFDMYVKDSQNRPNRKEREEISNLKKELADSKELLKLKETKSGATQARLRTQLKQLERENAELKQEVEKLQKENAKLNAAQLTRRPSEVKMLHEISRNITKLTEETLKKQTNKADTSCNTDRAEADKKTHCKNLRQGKKNLCSKRAEAPEDDGGINETSKHEMTTFANLSLEKQYENVFGHFSSIGTNNNNSLNDSKKERSEKVFEDGSKEIKYGNGNTKTVSPDGNLVTVRYYNGDVKETNLSENTLKYYYAENATWHTHYGDGTEVLEYPNGQMEKTYKDGRKEVTCTDGSFLSINPDGNEEVIYPDGSKIIKKPDGMKILLLPNGQKEIHTKEHKRREYPDGTVKILYPDGTQETRYASGRIRMKDANGVLIMDSQNSFH